MFHLILIQMLSNLSLNIEILFVLLKASLKIYFD